MIRIATRHLVRTGFAVAVAFGVWSGLAGSAQAHDGFGFYYGNSRGGFSYSQQNYGNRGSYYGGYGYNSQFRGYSTPYGYGRFSQPGYRPYGYPPPLPPRPRCRW